MIGRFEFGNGVDYVRVPGVVKLPNGDYTSLNLNLVARRGRRVRDDHPQTAAALGPDIVIVDKEPTGFAAR